VRARALFAILFSILQPDSKTKNEARDQLSLIFILKNVMRHSGDIMMKNKRKTLILCILLASVLMLAVDAAVYNSMFMQSSVGVK